MFDDDLVGYCKPPKETQFKKGKSGNPRGRPRRSPDLAKLVHRTLRERVSIQENGKRKNVTKADLIAKQLVHKAAAGNLRAFDQVSRLNRAAEEAMRVEIEQTENVALLSSAQLEQMILRHMTKKERKELNLPDPR